MHDGVGGTFHKTGPQPFQYLCRDRQLIEGFQTAPCPVLPLDASVPHLFLFLHTVAALSGAALCSLLVSLMNSESGFDLAFQYHGLILSPEELESS